MKYWNSRSGNILLLTTLVTVAVMSMVLSLATRFQAGFTITKVELAKQRARAASEAVASMMEARLTDIVATNDLANLTRNPDTGLLDDPWEGEQWFGDCIVRWRVEPMIVENEDGSEWSANPLANLIDYDSVTASNPTASYVANQNLYHFRIAAEAYALRDAQLLDDTSLAALAADNNLPWQNPENRLAMVQTARVIQISLSTLFKYALFYAPVGDDGDLEIHPGSSMDIAGNVHSNGAIYWRGTSGSVKMSGTDGQDVSVVGIDGIFMFHKPDMLKDHGESADPYALTTYKNYTGTNQRINGVPVNTANDSRNPGEMRNTFGTDVRDGEMGASVVRTLANIPELAGRPFELQRNVSPGTVVWTTNPANPADQTSWTIIPNDPPAAFYQDPNAGNFNFTDEADTDTVAVTAFAKRLYYIGDYTDASLYGAGPELTVTCDADNDGFLDHDGTTAVDESFLVEAHGLRRYFQLIGGVPIYQVMKEGADDGGGGC